MKTTTATKKKTKKKKTTDGLVVVFVLCAPGPPPLLRVAGRPIKRAAPVQLPPGGFLWHGMASRSRPRPCRSGRLNALRARLRAATGGGAGAGGKPEGPAAADGSPCDNFCFPLCIS